MEALVMTAQLILGLSILVGLHEFGHLIAAKAFGMRVEKYSIGFPPKIWGFQYGETEYSFGMIPLGGFVKISGMIDESLDVKMLSAEPEPWEFRAKPAWQRLIVMMGGIVVNVITGIIIFILMAYSQGESYLPKSETNKYGIVAYDLAIEIGLKTGDRILDISGKDYDRFTDLFGPDLILSTDAYYTVQRGDSVFKLDIPNTFIDKFSDTKKDETGFIGQIAPFSVAQVIVGSAAADGGLEIGDIFVSIEGQPAAYFHEFKAILEANKGKKISAVVKKSNNHLDSLTFLVSDEATLGFQPEMLLAFAHTDYTFAESIPKGTSTAFGIVWINIQGFGKIFSGDASVTKSLSGPIRIAQLFGGVWDWLKFWNLVGLLSMVLAFMNFLPIPALDGGHVVFITYEIVSGRKPSDKFLENAQKVGMVLLLGLMGFAIFNDIFQSIF